MEISQDNLRVASFSAYLNPADQESFALKIATVVQDAVPASMSTLESEIGTIFGANKYLNIKMEYSKPTKLATEQKEQAKSRVCFGRIKLLRCSSWTIDLSFFKGYFSCHGPCRKGGNKSDHHVDHGMVLDLKKENNPDDLSKKLIITEEPRKSIEVFGSQAAAKTGDDISKNLERKLSMLTWDAIPKKLPHKLINHSISIEPDVLSDGSSDLFEIEGTCRQSYDLNVLPSPPAADDVSGCMTPTSQYEPSEVSIDFSFASDFDDHRSKPGSGDLNLMIKKRVRQS